MPAPRDPVILAVDIGTSSVRTALFDLSGRRLPNSLAQRDAARLREELPERDYHARTGCMLRASYWPAKLRWLARERRSLFRRVSRWQSPAESLLGKLCEGGDAVCAYGMATGTGLFDPSTLCWDNELLALCGLRPEQVPRVVEGSHAARRSPSLCHVSGPALCNSWGIC